MVHYLLTNHTLLGCVNQWSSRRTHIFCSQIGSCVQKKTFHGDSSDSFSTFSNCCPRSTLGQPLWHPRLSVQGPLPNQGPVSVKIGEAEVSSFLHVQKVVSERPTRVKEMLGPRRTTETRTFQCLPRFRRRRQRRLWRSRIRMTVFLTFLDLTVTRQTRQNHPLDFKS